tara:strand:+ start:77 stop:1258 length:1182 start_codon:yes stop_codon:yes gene_type:complete
MAKKSEAQIRAEEEQKRKAEVGKAVLLIPWILIGTTTLFAVALMVNGYWWGIVLVAISIPVLVYGLTNVPAVAPASYAMLTVWGVRFPVPLREGKKLLANYFPFFIGVIITPIEYQNLDFTFTHIRTRLKSEGGSDEDENDSKVDPKSGGAVMTQVGLTVVADTERLEQYIIAGGVTPSTTPTNGTTTVLHDVLYDMLGEALRQEGAHRTWEEMTFSQERLTAILIELVTSEKPSRCGDLLKAKTETEKEKILNKIRKWLIKALENGVADIHDLGIKVRRLNVTRVEPDGALAETAERAAVEEQERRAEKVETEAVTNMAMAYVEASRKKDNEGKSTGEPTISFEEALKAVRIERGKAEEVIIRTSGDPIVSAAVAASKLLGNGQNKPTDGRQ